MTARTPAAEAEEMDKPIADIHPNRHADTEIFRYTFNKVKSANPNIV
jgi:hypothetical protein